MAPLSIAVGYKADGTPVHLYTGHNSLEALDKLDAAGSSKSITRGDIFHGMPAYRSRDYAQDGKPRDNQVSVDEHARMAHINVLKKLPHEELAERARKLGLPADAKALQRSMKDHMYMVVAVYDREHTPRPDIDGEQKSPVTPEGKKAFSNLEDKGSDPTRSRIEAREVELKRSADDALKASANSHGINIDKYQSILDDDERESLILAILEKEFPAPPVVDPLKPVVPEKGNSFKGLGK